MYKFFNSQLKKIMIKNIDNIFILFYVEKKKSSTLHRSKLNQISLFVFENQNAWWVKNKFLL